MIAFAELYSDRANYPPGGRGKVFGKMVNTGPTEVYVDDVRAEFEWGFYWCQTRQYLSPGEQQYFSVDFQVPQELVGTYSFGLGAFEQFPTSSPSWETSYTNYQPQPVEWTQPIFSMTPDIGRLTIRPSPTYSAFVSRSVWASDAPVLNPMVAMIEEHGFATHTIGVDIVADYPNLSPQVKNAIRANDCLVVITTKRDLSAISNRWKTFEWSHGETGIGYSAEKPILVLTDYEVQLGGLPASLPGPKVEFDTNNLAALPRDLSRVMPEFRNQIANNKSNELLGRVAKAAVPVAAFGIGVGLGMLLASRLK
jgi:hypothetical protein